MALRKASEAEHLSRTEDAVEDNLVLQSDMNKNPTLVSELSIVSKRIRSQVVILLRSLCNNPDTRSLIVSTNQSRTLFRTV